MILVSRTDERLAGHAWGARCVLGTASAAFSHHERCMITVRELQFTMRLHYLKKLFKMAYSPPKKHWFVAGVAVRWLW